MLLNEVPGKNYYSIFNGSVFGPVPYCIEKNCFVAINATMPTCLLNKTNNSLDKSVSVDHNETCSIDLINRLRSIFLSVRNLSIINNIRIRDNLWR